MEIKYVFDQKRRYDDELITHLRQYNIQFTGNKPHEKRFFYVKKNKELRGAISVSFSWDWVTIKSFYYHSTEALAVLVKAIWEKYGHQAVGIKFFTPVKETFEDFIQVGFVATNVVETTNKTIYYYADLYDCKTDLPKDYQIIHSQEELEKYIPLLKHHVTTYEEKYQVPQMQSELQLIALDQDQFVGGVRGELYGDTMYVSLLVVVEKYRHQDIGANLMRSIEAHAKQKNIVASELGTTDFQAKGFYLKMGYHVVHTRKDNPRGFNMYTLAKTL